MFCAAKRNVVETTTNSLQTSVYETSKTKDFFRFAKYSIFNIAMKQCKQK